MEIYQIIISIGLILMIAWWSSITSSSPNNKTSKRKEIEDELFEAEADCWGLTEEEKEDCIQSGLTPEEWMEENDPDYYQENK